MATAWPDRVTGGAAHGNTQGKGLAATNLGNTGENFWATEVVERADLVVGDASGDDAAAVLRTAFAAEHPSPKVKFLLASGNAGVMAATNEVVQAAQRPIVLWVFGAVIVLCLITFRSIRATLCIVVPLAIVSWLAYALMVYLGIGLKISTLPVVALGVGIGVDYGIYLFASLQAALKAGAFFEDAMFQAFKDTGAAIVFTGLTLGAGVSMWIFSDLKFQADMGLLLTFMFLVNMLGAIVLLPAMARWLFRHHTRRA